MVNNLTMPALLPVLAARRRWPSCWSTQRGQPLTQEPYGITFQMLAWREERPQRASGRSGTAASIQERSDWQSPLVRGKGGDRNAWHGPVRGWLRSQADLGDRSCASLMVLGRRGGSHAQAPVHGPGCWPHGLGKTGDTDGRTAVVQGTSASCLLGKPWEDTGEEERTHVSGTGAEPSWARAAP
jgi:hypothetical protein